MTILNVIKESDYKVSNLFCQFTQLFLFTTFLENITKLFSTELNVFMKKYTKKYIGRHTYTHIHEYDQFFHAAKSPIWEVLQQSKSGILHVSR